MTENLKTLKLQEPTMLHVVKDIANKEIITLKVQAPTMLYFVKDIPNICSLAGLMSAVLGIYFAVLGSFSYAMIGILWAVLFDWADGIIARKMKNRTENHKAFGPQLDSLIDIISFGVFPAVFLLSYGNYNPWFLPGAFLILATSSIRLSYFNVFGMVDSKTYKGLALDNNVIILALLFLFERFLSANIFAIVLYTFLMALMVFNLAPIKTPKFTGKWFHVLIGYTVVMTILYLFLT
ncbi:MAG: CDP-alcohol phosphatidyltransferase family protein [Spirochaetaceae bacterium]|jgi:phosphatidylserine synthase|nr:CDP-alcohol phosphatidyltransferase family protein [Spirochaetaceae bacterium]